MADFLSVLSPISTRGYANALLLEQLTRFNTGALSRQQRGITVDYQQQINSVGREGDQWRSVQADLETAVRFLDDLVDRVENIDTYAGKAISTSVLAQNGDSISDLGYEATFNSYLRSWVTEAEDRGGVPNLISSTTQSDFTYYVDTSGAYETIEPYDLTTGYYIIDSSGYRWQHDPDYRSLFQQIDETTGEETGLYAGTAGGLRLDSLVGDAVTFTYLPDTSDEQQFTGTLYRTGLEVLDAWLYEGLTTETGRATAQDDLDAARATIKAQLARFRAAAATATYYANLADTNIQALSSNIDSLTTAMALELQATEEESGRLNATNVLIVGHAQAIRDEYLKAFSLGQASGLARALIDVLA